MADEQLPIVKDYEVKYLLKNKPVIGRDAVPKKKVLEALEFTGEVTTLAMQFLDNERHRLNECGHWNVRVRRSDDDDERDRVELTFKKRYAAEDSDGGIQEARRRAAAEGFTGEGYKVQIEWGQTKRTLTLSREKGESAAALGAGPVKAKGDKVKLPLPGGARSVEWALKEIPDELASDLRGTGRRALETAGVYGPVTGRRYKCKWEGEKLSLEVWPIGDEDDAEGVELVVELSFKQDDKPTGDKGAFARRLQAMLDEEGWLADRDPLKTTLIIDRYAPGEKPDGPVTV